MSAATASQPVAAHQLGANLNAGPEVSRKIEAPSKLSGAVEADLSFFVPPEDGSAVSVTCHHIHQTMMLTIFL
jgi:hypothetical protein